MSLKRFYFKDFLGRGSIRETPTVQHHKFSLVAAVLPLPGDIKDYPLSCNFSMVSVACSSLHLRFFLIGVASGR